MKPEPENSATSRAVERDAAAWVVREERGLTPAEQDALSQWLAADLRHGPALRERRWAWREFDRIAGLPATVAAAPDPDLLAPRSAARPRKTVWIAVASAAFAAAAAIVLLLSPSAPPPALRPLSTALAAPCERRVLDDGSVIELNRGARITVDFSPGLRRVRLERGEAHFVVAKDAARPFVVEAAGVTARAVGTAFNVRLAATDVEIIVAEGRVAVGSESAAADVSPAPTVVVTTASAEEIARALAWQAPLLRLGGATLAERPRRRHRLQRQSPVRRRRRPRHRRQSFRLRGGAR